jgi:hypothetical protein
MTSVIGNAITTTPSGNFLLGKRSPVYNDKGIMHWLNTQPEFSIFAELVKKGGMCKIFDECGETLTLFPPPNSSMEGYIDSNTNPRLFVGAHTLRNKFRHCEFEDLFQTKDLFNKDSVIDAREDIIYYGKAIHSLTFSLEWETKAEIGSLQIECNNGFIYPISNPIYKSECKSIHKNNQ